MECIKWYTFVSLRLVSWSSATGCVRGARRVSNNFEAGFWAKERSMNRVSAGMDVVMSDLRKSEASLPSMEWEGVLLDSR